PARRTARLSLDKRSVAGAPASFPAAGVTLGYDYVLTNTGNVTLVSPAVSDDRIAAVSCPAGPIAPGASLICTASYTTLQSDLDGGGVTNIATATAMVIAQPPGDTSDPVVTSNSDSVTVPAVRTPALTVDKTAPAVDAADFVAGRTITFDFLVTNS